MKKVFTAVTILLTAHTKLSSAQLQVQRDDERSVYDHRQSNEYANLNDEAKKVADDLVGGLQFNAERADMSYWTRKFGAEARQKRREAYDQARRSWMSVSQRVRARVAESGWDEEIADMVYNQMQSETEAFESLIFRLADLSQIDALVDNIANRYIADIDHKMRDIESKRDKKKQEQKEQGVVSDCFRFALDPTYFGHNIDRDIIADDAYAKKGFFGKLLAVAGNMVDTACNTVMSVPALLGMASRKVGNATCWLGKKIDVLDKRRKFNWGWDIAPVTYFTDVALGLKRSTLISGLVLGAGVLVATTAALKFLGMSLPALIKGVIPLLGALGSSVLGTLLPPALALMASYGGYKLGRIIGLPTEYCYLAAVVFGVLTFIGIVIAIRIYKRKKKQSKKDKKTATSEKSFLSKLFPKTSII